MHRNRFFFYAAGIFVSYFYFGILQEKVTRGKYQREVEKDGVKSIEIEKYTFAITLVFVQCIVNTVVAKLATFVWPQGEDKTPKLYYASMSTTYLLAMICSNMALQWVPYPTQVVGKSAKPIPVMILGVLIGRKSYTFRKYIFVFMIVLGIVLFMLKDKAVDTTQDSLLGVGELLLFLSLLMDGLTGAIQERIRAESKPSGLEMMYCGNIWSTFFLSITIVVTGEYAQFYEFAQHYPFVINNLLQLAVMSSIGQLFLYSMDRIRAESKPSGLEMMYFANIWSTFFLFITIVASREYAEFYEFVQYYPYVVNNLLLLALMSCVGQLFIYSMVSEFGPLVVSVVTTTRKLFTYLASVIWFGNALTSMQWIGAIMVFTALFLDAFYSNKLPRKKVPNLGHY